MRRAGSIHLHQGIPDLRDDPAEIRSNFPRGATAQQLPLRQLVIIVCFSLLILTNQFGGHRVAGNAVTTWQDDWMHTLIQTKVGLKPGLAYQGRAQRQVNESDIYSQSDTETQPKNSGDEENDNIVPMDVETRLSIQHSNEPGLNDEPEDAEIQANIRLVRREPESIDNDNEVKQPATDPAAGRVSIVGTQNHLLEELELEPWEEHFEHFRGQKLGHSVDGDYRTEEVESLEDHLWEDGKLGADDTDLVEISLILGRRLGTTNPNFGCVSVDWWPRSKCDYGKCSWGHDTPGVSILSLNLSRPLFRSAVRELTAERSRKKLIMRLGGSLADYVYYQTNSNDTGSCHPLQPSLHSRLGYNHSDFCFDIQRWRQWNRFCKDARCRIAFGVNALNGREKVAPCPVGVTCNSTSTAPCCATWQGNWNPVNLQNFLLAGKEMGLVKPYSLQFGNELAGTRGILGHFSAEQYAQDFLEFALAVQAVYPTDWPLLVAGETGLSLLWMAEFLKTKVGQEVPDAISYHLYSLGPGSSPKSAFKMFNASHLEQTRGRASKVKGLMHHAAQETQLWVSEAGGAYNSGRPGVTDSFASSFWYLDEMAVMASQEHHVYCRQTLTGGNYALLDSARGFEPNPDYYALLLWRRLMGSVVLKLDAVEGSPNYLRVYAHCASSESGQRGDVTLLLLNIARHTRVEVNSILGLSLPLHRMARSEYHLTAPGATDTTPGDVYSKVVLLNGKKLEIDYSQTREKIPGLFGNQVKRDSNVPIVLGPQSYAFVLLQGARHRPCRFYNDPKLGDS